MVRGNQGDSIEEIAVLHVDDEPEFTELSASYLERIDDRIDVTPARTAREGLSIIDDATVDVVISDYDMPDTDGVEFLRAVRADYPGLPFILFTGRGDEGVASEAISAGVTDYLRKDPGGDQFRVLANEIATAVDRRRTQRALADQRARHAALFDDFPEPTVAVEFVDGVPIVRDVNRAFESTFGFDAGAAVEESVNDLIVPDEKRTEARRLDARARAGDAIDREIRRETPDGPRDFLFRNIDVDGDVDHYGVYEDVTERKARERELERYNDNLARLYRTANRLYAADSVEECYRLAIEAAVGILGFDWCTLAAPADDGDDFEIKAISEDTPLEVGDRPFKVDEGLAGHVYQTGEASVVTDVHGDDRGKPTDDAIRAALTVPVGRWGIFQAVRTTPDDGFDEQDRTNAELLVTSMITAIDRIEHQARLEAQNERLDAFARVVSHDLRNPLNVARGRLELARSEVESEHLAAVADAHERMGAIIDDLLTLAREGQAVETVTALDVHELAERCWASVDTTAGTLRIEDELTVRGDGSRLARLFENLFRNAVEHGSTGSRPSPDDSVEHSSTGSRPSPDDSVEHLDGGVTVTVGSLQDGFYVEDDGPGIPEADRDRVFAQGYTTSDEGIGLGLSIVRDTVAAHGWAIAVAEGTDGGARFEVTGVDRVDG